jgi:thymidylate synthase
VTLFIEIPSGRAGYARIARTVQLFGKPRAPRGKKTLDAGHVVIQFDSAYDALPVGLGRGLNPMIAAAEAIQLVAGRADHNLLPRISSAFVDYMEPTGFFHGAYGDRVSEQISHVVRKIKDDRDTRQAVVTLWDPTLDNQPRRRDYPCTVALNFAMVDDELELRTLMRSNDVWLGLPYDMFQFTQLQLTVARALDVAPGQYTHETWSLHVYEEHMNLIDQLSEPSESGPQQPEGFGRTWDNWHMCKSRASIILEGRTFHAHVPPTDSEQWYVDQLKPYVTGTSDE